MCLVHFYEERKMRAYSETYLDDVVESQGKLFDFVAQTFPENDTTDFIEAYMKSKTSWKGFIRVYAGLDWRVLCVLSMVL